jgi:hypothetical protein
MDLFAQALRAGRAQAATGAFNDLVAGAADPAALGGQLRLLLVALFDGFYVPQIATMMPWLIGHPAAEITGPAVRALQPRLEEAEEWRRTLVSIAAERHGRDLRALVRSRDVTAATAVAKAMLGEARTPEHRFVAARQMGVILGSLGTDRARCEQMLNAIEKDLAGISYEPAHFATLRQTYDQTLNSLSLTEMGMHERQWDRVLTQAIVDLMRRLPGRASTTARPGAEEEQRFHSALHAAVAGFFLGDTANEPAADRSARFLDLARVLREFCPVEARATGPVEGVEDVAFQRMSPTDRLVAVRVLRRLGMAPKLVETVATVARFCPAGRPTEILLTVMGGLSSESFLPQLAAALQDRHLAKMHDNIVEALGRIGGPRSREVLVQVLVELLGSRVFDPPLRVRIGICLAALGRIARHPDTSAAERNTIVLQAMKALPEDRALGRAALEQFFSWNPGALSPEAKNLAVRFAVDSLWTVEAHSRIARGNANQKTELGTREPLCNMLIAMGPAILPALVEAADRHALRYSGGILALAEVLTKIGDASTLPLLGKLLNLALRTDEGAIPDHLRESFFDGASNEFRPLSRDKVIHGLIYAIHETGGPAGLHVLRQLANRIRSGEFDSPGEETMTLLARILVEEPAGSHFTSEGLPAGGADVGGLAEPAVSLEEELSGRAVFGEKAAPAVGGPERRAREGEDIESLIKAIRSRGVFSSKVEQRISAIQEAAARGAVEAVPVLCETLEAKEKMLAAAAETALFQIVLPRDPDQRRYRDGLYSLLEAMRGAAGRKVKLVSLVIDRLQPEREPTRSLLLRYIDVEPEARLKKDAADIFRIANERLARSGRSMDLNISAATPGGAHQALAKPDGVWEATAAPLPGGPGAVTASKGFGKKDPLTLKREYFAARQAWAAGGKKTPEPPRPEGV